MNLCIDCNKELTVDNKSLQQSTIRCVDCYKIFAEQTEKFLDDCIIEMDEKKPCKQ
jgi:hypothetical protein